jgi:RepB DNA-primase from phage plasmid
VTKLDEAFRMLDAFTSVGADSFVVTKTDILQTVKWGKPYTVPQLREQLPAMVRTATIRRPCKAPEGVTFLAGENLIFRPTGKGVAFLQLDDLADDKLEKVRPAAFLIHATSPGSHQAWFAVSGLPEGKEPFKEFMRRVRKAVGGNDKAASHATRVAGTENFKVKYAPDYPVVTILETHPGRIMSPEQLEALGLVARREPMKTTVQAFRPQARGDGERSWPDYQRCLAGAPPATKHEGPDESMADFFWCMLAAQRGWSIEEAAGELLKVSGNAQDRARRGDEGYALITAQNAAAAATRGRREGRG